MAQGQNGLNQTQKQFNHKGHVIITSAGTSQYQGSFYGIIASANGATLSSLTPENGGSTTSDYEVPKQSEPISNFPLPVGVPIYGRFTEVTVSSGEVMLLLNR